MGALRVSVCGGKEQAPILGQEWSYAWDTPIHIDCVLFRSQSLYNSPLPEVLEKLVTDFKDHLKKQKETSDRFNKFSDVTFKEANHKTATQAQVSRHQTLSVVSLSVVLPHRRSLSCLRRYRKTLQHLHV